MLRYLIRRMRLRISLSRVNRRASNQISILGQKSAQTAPVYNPDSDIPEHLVVRFSNGKDRLGEHAPGSSIERSARRL